MILLPYQQRWCADKSRIRLAEKSRRIGWSWAVACEMTINAAQSDGCDGWYTGYNKDMTEEFIRDVADWAKQFNLAASEIEEGEIVDEDKNILTFTIRFKSGFRVTALSSKPSNLRNKKGHICIDEAAHHDDLPGMLKSALAVLMWGGKSRVDIISTHNGVDNAFNKLVQEVTSGKKPYSHHRVTLDDALADGLYKRICLVNGWAWSKEAQNKWRALLFAEYGDDALEELMCVPHRSGGTYLNRSVVERQMIHGPVHTLALDDEFVHWTASAREGHVDAWLYEHIAPLIAKLDRQQLHFFGQDFGRVSDRSVIAPGELGKDLRKRHPFAIEMLNVPFDQQKQVLWWVVDHLPRFFRGAMDATGNGAHLAELTMQKYGASLIECVNMTDKWYSENLPRFKRSLDDRNTYLVKNADHLIDLMAFKTINGLPKLPKAKTKPVEGGGPPRHGDAAIAYVLADMAASLPIMKIGYTPATNERQQRRDSSNAIQRLRSRRTGVM